VARDREGAHDGVELFERHDPVVGGALVVVVAIAALAVVVLAAAARRAARSSSEARQRQDARDDFGGVEEREPVVEQRALCAVGCRPDPQNHRVVRMQFTPRASDRLR
jgi:hypothetical protein